MVLSIAFIAVALGLSNFAASIAMGLVGVDAKSRREIIVTFGFFEAIMPLCGLALGRRLAESVGSSASYVGGSLLALTGLYTLIQARRSHTEGVPSSNRAGLIVTGAALSVDNLVVGFALGAYRVPVVLAAIVIAVISVAMSLLGLEIGSRLSASVEKWSAELGAAVLIIVGIAISFRVL